MMQDRSFYTQDDISFVTAIKHGEVENVRALVTRSKPKFVIDPDKSFDLQWKLLLLSGQDNQIKKDIFNLISQCDPRQFFLFCRNLNEYEFKNLIDLDIDLNIHHDNLSLIHYTFGLQDGQARRTLLVSHGANVSTLSNRDYKGNLLHTLIANESFSEVIELMHHTKLCGQTIDFNARDKEGKTILMLATRVMSAEVVKYILSENPACVDIPDNMGRTPLHIACALGKANMVKMLLEAGANKNARDNLGNTPAHYAVVNEQIVKMLLSGVHIDPERDVLAKTNSVMAQYHSPFLIPAMVAKEFGIIPTSIPSEMTARQGTILCEMLSSKENLKHLEKMVKLKLFDGAQAEIIRCELRSFQHQSVAKSCIDGQPTVIRMLKDHQANMNLSNQAGKRPIDVCKNEKAKKLLATKEKVSSSKDALFSPGKTSPKSSEGTAKGNAKSVSTSTSVHP